MPSRKKASKRKNAPGQGRKPNDKRGLVKAKMMYLLPEQAQALVGFAAAEGYASASQFLATWIDSGCPGASARKRARRAARYAEG